MQTSASLGEKSPPGSRALAIVHTAIFDAVNAVTHRYQPFAVQIQAAPGASPEAAAAAAAHATLVTLYPTQQAKLDAAYAASVAQIAAGAPRNDGVSLGEAVAARILELRKNDGSEVTLTYNESAGPGVWQPPPPKFTAVFVGWGKLKPWVLQSPSQFRAPGPPKLESAQYAADYNEAKSLGAAVSTVRTAEQTQIGYFWKEDSHVTWNNLARQIALQQGSDLTTNARLFALFNVAGADAYIALYDSKYFYHFWRPIAAIPEGENDGNPNTVGDPNWKPLVLDGYPSHPDYVSGHSAYGSAAATALARLFGSDATLFSFTTSTSPASAVRSFQSFSQAAAENGDSRIYIGFHFRTAVRDGITLGAQVANWDLDHAIPPLP